MLDISRRVRDSMMMSEDDERRVFYVGATRARKNLFLIEPTTQVCFDPLS